MANVEKIIGDNIASNLSARIAVMEIDDGGLISMKLHNEIDEESYCREYQRLGRELTDFKIKKDEIDKTNLQKKQDINKMTIIKDIIGDGTKPLTEFYEDLFEAMVEKVIIRSQTEFEFHLESGQILMSK